MLAQSSVIVVVTIVKTTIFCDDVLYFFCSPLILLSFK